MIQEFSVKNFLSFKEKHTINFLASSDKTLLEELTFEPKSGVKILKLMMIYGANASGKSNLIIAIQTLWMMFISPLSDESDKIEFYRPFELSKDESSEFEIIFWKDRRKFKYKIEFNENEILKEKLEYNTDSGILSDLYERELGKDIKFGSTIEIKAKERSELNTNTLKNHTVLSTLNKKNIHAPKVLLDLYNWIRSNVHEIDAYNDALEIAENATKNTKTKEFLLDILCKADFNITDIKILESKLNDKLIQQIISDNSLDVTLKEKLLKPQKQVIFYHKGESENFPISFGLESKGTRAYFRLARLLLELQNGGSIVLEDELEDSLHYELLLHFIETFLRIENDNQLIFTTHNQMLLDENWMLRRDMVCLVEKSKNTSSSGISRVSDLGLHKNLSLLNAYRIGKLGAKPTLGSTL